MIVRAENLNEDLKSLTQQVGLTWQAPPPAPLPQGPELSEIYDTEFESLPVRPMLPIMQILGLNH